MLEIRLFVAAFSYSGSKWTKIPYIHSNFSFASQPRWRNKP